MIIRNNKTVIYQYYKLFINNNNKTQAKLLTADFFFKISTSNEQEIL